jgi:hypothetical protein
MFVWPVVRLMKLETFLAGLSARMPASLLWRAVL